ncbi:hypothetical protein ACFLYR_06505 [Chloroflexota bacterium]
MCAFKYVISKSEKTTATISRGDLKAIRAWAWAHKQTGTTAHHLIIVEGLLSLMAKEERAEVDRDLRILQLGQEFLKEERKKSKRNPLPPTKGRGTTQTST